EAPKQQDVDPAGCGKTGVRHCQTPVFPKPARAVLCRFQKMVISLGKIDQPRDAARFQRTRNRTTPWPGASAEYPDPAPFCLVWRHTPRIDAGVLEIPASAHRNVILASPGARLTTATAVSPPARSLVHISCWPDCQTLFA